MSDVAADEEQLGASWEAATAAAEQEVLAWRRERPRPTLTELEQVAAGAAQRRDRG